jgi:hypothetical protein
VHPGHHPGPFGCYLLAPLYRLLGGSYWALRASLMALNALAIVSAVLLARRRDGTRGVVLIGLVIALLQLGFGLARLSEAWNPHMPLVWFVAFLVSVWCVLDGDLALLPAVVGIGSLCGQTHIPYLPLCGALGAAAAARFALSWVRARRAGFAHNNVGGRCWSPSPTFERRRNARSSQDTAGHSSIH